MAPCRRCGGTGYLPALARVDGGKCWSCTDKADTSHTRNVVPLTDAEAAANWNALCEQRKAARRARRAEETR